MNVFLQFKFWLQATCIVILFSSKTQLTLVSFRKCSHKNKLTSLQTLDIIFFKKYMWVWLNALELQKNSKSVDSYWKPRCLYSFFKSNFLFGHLLIKYIELLSFELKIESCNPCIYSFYNHWGDRFIKKNDF